MSDEFHFMDIVSHWEDAHVKQIDSTGANLVATFPEGVPNILNEAARGNRGLQGLRTLAQDCRVSKQLILKIRFLPSSFSVVSL